MFTLNPNFHFGNKSATNDFSSFNSATVASIFDWLNASMVSPWTISSFCPLLRIGKEQINPHFQSRSCRPDEGHTLCQSPAGVGFTMDATLSMTAFAALAAWKGREP